MCLQRCRKNFPLASGCAIWLVWYADIANSLITLVHQTHSTKASYMENETHIQWSEQKLFMVMKPLILCLSAKLMYTRVKKKRFIEMIFFMRSTWIMYPCQLPWESFKGSIMDQFTMRTHLFFPKHIWKCINELLEGYLQFKQRFSRFTMKCKGFFVTSAYLCDSLCGFCFFKSYKKSHEWSYIIWHSCC